MASATNTSKRKRGAAAADEGTKKRNYYKQIQGVKYDKGMLEVVDTATTNKNKINVEDCKKLLKEVIDGDMYTDVEKQTMKYIREHYKFEPTADQWIRRAISSWASRKAKRDADSGKKDEKEEKEETLYCSCNYPDGGRKLIGCDANLAGCYDWYHMDCVGLDAKAPVPEVWFCPQCKSKKSPKKYKDKDTKASYYKQINGKKYDKGMLDAADASKGKNNRILIEDAKIIFKETVDGDKITDTEYETLDYIHANYEWTPKADEWLKNAVKSWEVDHPRKKKRETKKKEQAVAAPKKSTRAKKAQKRSKTPDVDADGDTRIDTGSQKDEDLNKSPKSP